MDENLTLDQMLEMAHNLTEQLEAAKKREELSGDDLLRAILDKLTDIERQIAAQRQSIHIWPYITYPQPYTHTYRWEKIIVGDVPNPPYTISSGATWDNTTHSLADGFNTVVSQ